MTKTRIVLDGVEPIEAMELGEEMADASVEVVSLPPQPDGRHGSPDLISIAIELYPYMVSAISVLALFIVRKRTAHQNLEDFSAERRPDGSVRIRLKKTSSRTSTEPPDTKVVEALTAELRRLICVEVPPKGENPGA